MDSPSDGSVSCAPVSCRNLKDKAAKAATKKKYLVVDILMLPRRSFEFPRNQVHLQYVKMLQISLADTKLHLLFEYTPLY